MKNLFLFIAFIWVGGLFGQNYYQVYFLPKEQSKLDYYKQNKLELLTQKAIDRRVKYSIDLDFSDVPIEQGYIDQLSAVATIVKKSKWLNSAIIVADANQFALVQDLSCVSSVILMEDLLGKKSSNTVDKFEFNTQANILDSDIFLNHIKTKFLHNLNLYGAGVEIAVIDAGYEGVNQSAVFQQFFNSDRLLGTYNFVGNDENVFQYHYHGTSVLSTMALNESNYVGSAPQAKYWLLISEDVSSETPLEEFNWANAAEFADSVGVDIINTSLGYATFDVPFKSHTYSDLDGVSTNISKAATIASSKGILLVNSAGNEGNNAWHYIMTPADNPNIISVGAVDSEGLAASFTSYGPTFDNRVKPDVSALGKAVPLYNQFGNLVSSSGTSFASPILAGSCACLLEAFPQAKPIDIIDALRTSASLFSNPDSRLGYGIANMEAAYNILLGNLKTDSYKIKMIEVFPNPATDYIEFNFGQIKSFNYKILNIKGQLIENGNCKAGQKINVSQLSSGTYIIVFDNYSESFYSKFVK